MEKRSRSGEKKRSGGYGGGGIGGLIVVGGALAIAGFVAAFTIKKRRKSFATNKNSSNKSSEAPNNNDPKTEEQENRGPRFLVQAPDHVDDSTCSAAVNSTLLAPALREEKNMTEIDVEKIPDIPLSGNIDIPVEDDYDAADDSNYSEGTMSSESTLGEKKEDEASLSVSVTEDDPKTRSVEDIRVADDDGGGDEENVEVNSEGTEKSSIELNTEAVWPAELMEGMPKLEVVKKAEQTAEEVKTSKAGEPEYLDGGCNANIFRDGCDQNEKRRKESKALLWHKNETVASKEATANSSKMRIWFLSMLVLVLLLLSFSFTPHKAMSLVISLFSDVH